MGHVQTLYNYASLDANMCLDVNSIDYYEGTVEASGNDLEQAFSPKLDLIPDIKINPINFSFLRDNLIPTLNQSPDLFVFLTYKGGASGTVGIAWVGTVCFADTWKGYRVGINECFLSDITSAKVRLNFSSNDFV